MPMSTRSVLIKICDHNLVSDAAWSHHVAFGRADRMTGYIFTDSMTQTQKCWHTAGFTPKVLKQTKKYGCLASNSKCLRAARSS